nr:hypothetical protein [Tanacetum cinerariifolium]
MADYAWIKEMQEELHQFDRLNFWELVDKPFGKTVNGFGLTTVTSVLTAGMSSRKDSLIFKERKLRDPKLLISRNLLLSTKELHSKTLISFVMLALGRVIGLLLLKRKTAHRLLALSVASKHSGKKGHSRRLVLLHSIDRGVSVDVPWHVAMFFANKAKGYKKKSLIDRAHLICRIARSFGLMTLRALRGITLGPETSLQSVTKLVELGIYKYNALGYGEIVDDVPKVVEDEGAGAGLGQANVGGVRCHPNMTTTNRHKAMDERLGDIKTDISRLVGDVDELTYVVSRMSDSMTSFMRSLDSRGYNMRGSKLGTLITFFSFLSITTLITSAIMEPPTLMF